jgi:hypothetical protein
MIPATLLGLVPAQGNMTLFLVNEGLRLRLRWVKQLSEDPMLRAPISHSLRPVSAAFLPLWPNR